MNQAGADSAPGCHSLRRDKRPREPRIVDARGCMPTELLYASDLSGIEREAALAIRYEAAAHQRLRTPQRKQELYAILLEQLPPFPTTRQILRQVGRAFSAQEVPSPFDDVTTQGHAFASGAYETPITGIEQEHGGPPAAEPRDDRLA